MNISSAAAGCDVCANRSLWTNTTVEESHVLSVGGAFYVLLLLVAVVQFVRHVRESRRFTLKAWFHLLLALYALLEALYTFVYAFLPGDFNCNADAKYAYLVHLIALVCFFVCLTSAIVQFLSALDVFQAKAITERWVSRRWKAYICVNLVYALWCVHCRRPELSAHTFRVTPPPPPRFRPHGAPTTFRARRAAGMRRAASWPSASVRCATSCT
jgi:hypothetical protein